MPVVPKYDGSQIQERGLPSSRVPTQAPDSLTSTAGIANLGNNVVKLTEVIDKGRSDADQIAVMNADKQLTELETELLYNPESGALNKKGKDSFNLPGEVSEAYKARAQEIEKSLTSDSQKAAFQKLAQERSLGIGRTIDRHVGGEIRAYDEAETLSYVKTQMDTALTAYKDPEKVRRAVEAQQLAIATHADRNGMPAEWVKQKTEEAASTTYKKIISQMVDEGDDVGAEAFYKANEAFIRGEDQGAVKKELEVATTLGFAQRNADRILSKGTSPTQAYAMAKQLTEGESPKKRKALEDEISRQITIRKQAEREGTEDLHRNVKNILDSNGYNVNDPKIQKAFDRFSLDQQKSLEKYAEDKLKGRDTSDPQYYRDLQSLAANDPEKFKEMNLNDPKVYNKLSRSDYDKMLTAQNNARKGKTDKAIKKYQTDEQIIAGAMERAKISTKTQIGKEKAGLLKDKYYAALRSYSEANGKEMPESQQAEIAKQLTTEVVLDKGLFGTGFFQKKKRVFEMDDEDQAQAFNEMANENRKAFTTAKNKPTTVRQNGVTFKLNPQTGKYERQ